MVARRRIASAHAAGSEVNGMLVPSARTPGDDPRVDRIARRSGPKARSASPVPTRHKSKTPQATSRAGRFYRSKTAAMLTTIEEPQVGIEPTTARLRIECSTTELLWRSLPVPLPLVHMPWRGLEPRRLAAPPPQDGVSTNFTTRANHTALTSCQLFSDRRSEFPNARTRTLRQPSAVQHGSDGVRTRDLSSDSRVL